MYGTSKGKDANNRKEPEKTENQKQHRTTNSREPPTAGTPTTVTSNSKDANNSRDGHNSREPATIGTPTTVGSRQQY
jgi:hypothetical protein